MKNYRDIINIWINLSSTIGKLLCAVVWYTLQVIYALVKMQNEKCKMKNLNDPTTIFNAGSETQCEIGNPMRDWGKFAFLHLSLSAILMLPHLIPAFLGGSLVVLSLLSNPLSLHASVPQIINYQGRLTDANNNPLSGNFNVVFRICGNSTCSAAGDPIWTESHTAGNQITVSNGVYSVILGSLATLPFSAFDGDTTYLEVQVSGETLLPRQRLTSVSYAYNSARLEGYDSSFYVSTSPAAQTIEGTKTFTAFPVKSGGLTPSAGEEFATKSYVDSTAGGGIGSGSSGQTLRHNGSIWTANNLLTNNGTNIGINTVSPSSKIDVVGGSITVRGSNAGLVVANGNVGIGTTAPTANLDLNGTSIFRGTLNMVNNSITAVNDFHIGDPGDQEGIFWDGSAAKIFVSPLNSGNSDGYLRLINDGGIVFEPGVEDTEVMTLTSGGNVGIGTTNPGRILDVVSRMRVSNSGGSAGIWYADGTTERQFAGVHTHSATGDSQKWGVFNNSAWQMIVQGNGSVGIGTLDPLFNLHVVGDTRGTGHLALGVNGIVGSDTILDIDETFTADVQSFGLRLDPAFNFTASANRNMYGQYTFADANNINENSFNVDLYATRSEARITEGSTVNDAFGVYGYAHADHITGTVDSLWGLYGLAINDNAGVTTNVRGVYGHARNDQGSASNVYGGQFEVRNLDAGGTITNARGVTTQIYETAGTITTGYSFFSDCNDAATCYGLYIAAGDPEVTTDWGVYETGADKNYFSADVGIGVGSPSEKLDVVGNAEINGNIIVTGTVDGRDVAADGAKLDGITTGSADTTNDSWSGTGNITMTSGNVGIGTTSPGEALEVNGSIKTTDNGILPHLVMDSISTGDNWTNQGAYISIGESGALGSASMHMTYTGDGWGRVGAGTVTSGIPAGGYWQFLYNASRIYTPSNVGIGSTNPTAPLEVAYANSSTAVPAIAIDSSGSQAVFDLMTGGVKRANIRADSSGNLVLGSTGTGDIYFGTPDGTYRMLISDGGNVGIGTTNPGAILDLAAAGENAIEFDNGGARFTIHDGFGNFNIKAGVDGNNVIDDATTGGSHIRLDSAGYIHLLIDEATTVGGNFSASAGLTINGGLTNVTGDFAVGSSDLFVDDSANNVGIGTAAPGSKLHVNGTIIASDPTANNHVATKSYVDAASKPKTWYRTSTIYNGSTADTGCTTGYHMCYPGEWIGRVWDSSLGDAGDNWELHAWLDPHTGRATFWATTDSSQSMYSDCSNWSGSSSSWYGTAVRLSAETLVGSDDTTVGNRFTPRLSGDITALSCATSVRVMCCED